MEITTETILATLVVVLTCWGVAGIFLVVFNHQADKQRSIERPQHRPVSENFRRQQEEQDS